MSTQSQQQQLALPGLFLFKFTDAIFILLVCVNTLLSLDGIGAQFTTEELKYSGSVPNRTVDAHLEITTRSILEDDMTANLETYRSNLEEYADCDYSNALPKVLAKCPHRSLPIQIGLMAAFGGFYLIVLLVRQYYCSTYSTDDFRFFFYIDQWNNSKVSRLLFLIGTLISFAVMILGFTEAAEYDLGIAAVWPVLMFFVLNVKGLFFTSDYVKNMDWEVWEQVFSEPIPMIGLPNGEGWLHAAGLAFSRKNFFLALIAAMTDQCCGRGGLANITTKPDELLKMMVLLSLEDEEKIKMFMEKNAAGGNKIGQGQQASESNVANNINEPYRQQQDDKEMDQKQV